MVALDRITTGTGDGGTTRLADGSEVAKDAALIEAIGALDEVNAAVGMARIADGLDPLVADICEALQHMLFDAGSDLAVPPGGPHESHIPRMGAAHVARLDGWIDQLGARLEPLTSFVLPGGSPAAAALHVARTDARRAERRLIAAIHAGLPGRDQAPELLVVLNRLSDLLFKRPDAAMTTAAATCSGSLAPAARPRQTTERAVHMTTATPDRIAHLNQLIAKRIVVLDGGMGTMIQRHTLVESDFRGEAFADHEADLNSNGGLLSITRDEIIAGVHRAHYRVGSGTIETNTFLGHSSPG